MIAWAEFIAAVLLITVTGWAFWDDIGEWYTHAQREAVLDELWSEDSETPETVLLEVVQTARGAERS